jgi:hypothetical protein
VLLVTTKDFLRFLLPAQMSILQLRSRGSMIILVWLVYIVDGDDGEMSIIPEIAQSESRSWLDLQLINQPFRNIQRDGNGEEAAVCESDILDDTISLVSISSS